MKLKFILFSFLIFSLCSCQQCNQDSTDHSNAIYHWKSTFKLNNDDIEFINQHNIKRIYLKMFDVVIEKDINTSDIVPVATTVFLDTIPSGIEIVPTVYITIDALRAMKDDTITYGNLIAERIMAMVSYNNCGTISEVQLDCDWTKTTRNTYFALCQSVRSSLERIIKNDKQHIALSSTIRLHQLKEQAPPVDRGVLMLYNTDNIKNPDTKNSILNPATVKQYMTSSNYGIPLSYAYPAFGWNVIFQNGKFKAIASERDSVIDKLDGINIRYERPSASDILATKVLVEKALGQPAVGNIIYHLDSSQLSNYTNDEINQIYSRN